MGEGTGTYHSHSFVRANDTNDAISADRSNDSTVAAKSNDPALSPPAIVVFTSASHGLNMASVTNCTSGGRRRALATKRPGPPHFRGVSCAPVSTDVRSASLLSSDRTNPCVFAFH